MTRPSRPSASNVKAPAVPAIVTDYLKAVRKVARWRAAKRPGLSSKWADRAQRILDTMTADAARLALRLAEEQ